MTLRIGVLAIQGDVAENVSSLENSITELNQDAQLDNYLW
jgi:glutamine amidotransferase PdxT